MHQQVGPLTRCCEVSLVSGWGWGGKPKRTALFHHYLAPQVSRFTPWNTLQLASNLRWWEENSLVPCSYMRFQNSGWNHCGALVRLFVCVRACICWGLKGIGAAQPKHVVTFFLCSSGSWDNVSFCPCNIRNRPRLPSAAHCALTEGVKWSLTRPLPICLERPFTLASTAKKDPACSC